MNLDDIDRLLSTWQTQLDCVSQNLLELQELPTYQRLAGEGGFPKEKLTGVTEAQVKPTLEAINDLFQYFEMLLATINKANQLRVSLPRFLASEQKIREIEEILTTASIQLPVVRTPLAQRGLLSAATRENFITPDRLLAAMTQAFETSRDVILAIDTAWLNLEPILINAQTEIIAIQKLANSLGIATLPELTAAQEKLKAINNKISTDPLAVSGNFHQEIEPIILQAKSSLQQLAKQRQEIKENIQNGYKLLNKLIELNHQAKTALAESQVKVTDHSQLQTPLPQAEIDALSQWLNRLETKFNEGLFTPVNIGWQNWNAKAREYIAREEKAFAANQKPIETRMELRGRLDALQAKALARGMAEDKILSELGQQAKELLYTRPTPLDKATELVLQYEKRLNGK